MTIRALTIAGSDPSGGAGIQADLKTFAAFGAYGMSVLTALTAQNTLGVEAIHELPPKFVRAQLRAVLSDIGADGIKTGMLSSAAIVRAVADELEASGCTAPLVVDPVMVAKSGDRLLREDAVEAMVEELLPRATLITPNTEEATWLTGKSIASDDDAEQAAAALLEIGPKAVLLKGGHRGGGQSDDLFACPERCVWLRGERLDQRHTHGTGCTLSAAIVVRLGAVLDPLAACRDAKRYIAGAIRHATAIGKGIGPVNHLWEIEKTQG